MTFLIHDEREFDSYTVENEKKIIFLAVYVIYITWVFAIWSNALNWAQFWAYQNQKNQIEITKLHIEEDAPRNN